LKDLPKLSEFGVELLKFHVKFDPYFTPDKNAKNTYSKFFKKCIYSGNKNLLVAEKNRSIVGYALGEIRKRPPVFKLKKIGFVNDMYVKKNFRRQGIARLFLDELFSWFKSKKLNHVELHVHAENEIGKIAWAKYGFKEYMKELRTKM